MSEGHSIKTEVPKLVPSTDTGWAQRQGQRVTGKRKWAPVGNNGLLEDGVSRQDGSPAGMRQGVGRSHLGATKQTVGTSNTGAGERPIRCTLKLKVGIVGG